MPGIFSGINMLGQTMRLFQQGMDVTGHNISNLNSTGYSRQTIGYSSTNPESQWGIGGAYMLGTGVTISGVNRQRDMLLDRSMRNSIGDMGKFSSLAGAMKQVEGVFPEPSGPGISDALSKFFDGWSALGSNPGDPAAKLQLRLAADTLTSRVRAAHGQLSNQLDQVDTQINSTMDQIDQLSSQIAGLNEMIVSAQATGAVPNDLLDQRDQLIEGLSSLVDVQTHVSEDGSVRLYSGEVRLVEGSTSFDIPRTYDLASGTISDGARTYQLKSGALLGVLQGGQSVRGVMNQLDTLANELRTQVNLVHTSGVNTAGDTGVSFFNDSVPQTGAADFDLSDDIKASAENIMSGSSGSSGDGALALTLSGMRDTKFSGLSNQTFSGFFSGVLGSIGRDSVSYANAVDTTGAMLTQLDNQRQVVSGVNLDEEMTNLLRYQRSYQAAARALSVFNDVAEDLVNLIR